MGRFGLVGAALLGLAMCLPAQAQRPVWEQAGTLNCDVSGGIGFIVGSQRRGELPVHAELSGPARAVCRHHHQGRPRSRRHRRRPARLGGAHVDHAPARRAGRLLCGRVRGGDRRRRASAPTCWSAAMTVRSRCSRSRSRGRSASTSRPASPRSRCNSCADAASRSTPLQPARRLRGDRRGRALDFCRNAVSRGSCQSRALLKRYCHETSTRPSAARHRNRPEGGGHGRQRRHESKGSPVHRAGGPLPERQDHAARSDPGAHRRDPAPGHGRSRHHGRRCLARRRAITR